MMQKIILVYTMGKVGSGTIYHTLKNAFPEDIVIHTHFLSDHFLKTVLPNLDPRNTVGFEEGFKIRSLLKQNTHMPLKIITLTREPISRDISDLFQKLDLYFEKAETTPTLSQLQDQIEKSMHYHPQNWFDLEFKNFTNFDIYQFPFDKEKGYTIYHPSDFDLLCIRQENLKEIGVDALNVFLESAIDRLRPFNIRENTEVKKLYSSFKKFYQASGTKLAHVYDSKYVRHFYDEVEISQFRDRWSRRDSPLTQSHQKPKSLLLLCLARSGSSFISALLNTHPEVEFRAEYLNNISREKSTPEKLRKLSNLYHHESNKKIIGCSINPFKYKIDIQDLQKFIHEEIDYLILLTRQNTLKQYTSIQLRLARDRRAGLPDWKSAGRGGEYGHSQDENILKINIDIKDAKFWIQRLNHQKKTLSDIYHNSLIPKTEIIYEELLKDKQHLPNALDNLLKLNYTDINLEGALDYLPVDNKQSHKIKFSKISPREIKNQVVNFNELTDDPFFEPYL